MGIEGVEMAADGKKEGYTANDASFTQFYYIAGANAVAFVLLLAIFSTSVPTGIVSSFSASSPSFMWAQESETAGWFTLGKTKWAAGAKPWIMDHEEASEDKAKVVAALKNMTQCDDMDADADGDGHVTEEERKRYEGGDHPCSRITSNAEVLAKLLDEIDTKEELAEFKGALRQQFTAAEEEEFNRVFELVRAYVKATRAEMMDPMFFALLAGGFGLLMFKVFNKYADACAKETDEVENTAQ